MSRGFDFETPTEIDGAQRAEDAVREHSLNYLRDQVGWTVGKIEERVEVELAREIPRSVLNDLASRGWDLEGSRVLDVGCGQGGTVVEALERGADAYGVEPGPEFRRISELRVDEAGHDPSRVSGHPGEELPFPDESFDYVISLQVLEHVPDPGAVMQEMFRVLRPRGRCYISCENYLSFRENHYRVPWLPLLPKSVGARYLRLLGRDPEFLRKYVHYTTYPQIWLSAAKVGFKNRTYRIGGSTEGVVGGIMFPVRRIAFPALMHLLSFWRSGIRVHLEKPDDVE